jgi:preprotein translocase subunit SecD
MSNNMGYVPVPPVQYIPPLPQKSGTRKFFILFAIVLAALVLVAGAVFAYIKVGQYLFTPVTTVVFEPDLNKVSTVSHSDLEEAAAILKARFNALGYDSPKIAFDVEGNDRITATIPAEIDETTLESISAVGLVEFVEMGSIYVGPGTRISTDYYGEALPGGDGLIHHSLMTNREFASVTVTESPYGDFQIGFTLTETGTALFYEFTASHVGEYLAITLDGVVIECPVISSAITNGEGVLQGNFTQQSAENLAAVLITEPLPIPLK